MDFKFFPDYVLIENADSFDPKDVLTCGQAFRFYEEEDKSFTLVAHKRVINLKKTSYGLIIKGTNEEDFNNIWKEYFDLNRDYKKIKNDLSKIYLMVEAIKYGEGIRILNQEKFETVISFIISANNGIKRIRGSIEKISNLYGDFLGADHNRTYYSFPSPSVLKNVDPAELRQKTGVGFRDKRIVEAARMIDEGLIDLEEIDKMNLEDARENLQVLPGVGPKVSDCILLFAFKRHESFPVDVWIKRVMEELYLNKKVPKNKVADYGRKVFGPYAGFANQYLFYYGRDNKIGVKKW